MKVGEEEEKIIDCDGCDDGESDVVSEGEVVGLSGFVVFWRGFRRS